MNNQLYSHLYLLWKNVFTLKKFFTFANILTEEPGNWFAVAKMQEIHLMKKETLRKEAASLLKISLWDFSVSACANQPLGFSVSGTSAPNGLFQTINGSKRLIGYSKHFY